MYDDDVKRYEVRRDDLAPQQYVKVISKCLRLRLMLRIGFFSTFISFSAIHLFLYFSAPPLFSKLQFSFQPIVDIFVFKMIINSRQFSVDILAMMSNNMSPYFVKNFKRYVVHSSTGFLFRS